MQVKPTERPSVNLSWAGNFSRVFTDLRPNSSAKFRLFRSLERWLSQYTRKGNKRRTRGAGCDPTKVPDVSPHPARCNSLSRGCPFTGGSVETIIVETVFSSSKENYHPGQKSRYTWPFLTISPFSPPSPIQCWIRALKVSPLEQHCVGKGEGQVFEKEPLSTSNEGAIM